MLEEFRTQRIIWDKANKRIFDPIQTSGGDQNGRRLEVQILNNGEVEDLTGSDLYLAWQTRNKNHSGLEPFDTLDASEGTFELYYPTGMLAHAGALRGGLALVDSDGRIVSREFIIQVDRNIVDDEAAESSNEFTALTEALVKVNDLEGNYAPRLNEVTAQLAQKTKELSDIKKRANKKVVFDDFTQGLSKWYHTGGFVITNGQLTAGSGVNEPPHTNIALLDEVEDAKAIEVKLGSAPHNFRIAFGRDTENFLYVTGGNNLINIYTVEAGKLERTFTLTTTHSGYNTGDLIKVVRHGQSLQIYRNGILLGTYVTISASNYLLPENENILAGITQRDNVTTWGADEVKVAPKPHKYMHFSIDDVIAVFEDLTNNQANYSSMFDNAFLGELKRLHDTYGAVFSLYCFNQSSTFSLTNMTAKFKNEFRKNAHWLKLGFHANSEATNYNTTTTGNALLHYNDMMGHFNRFAHLYAVDKVVRTGFYSGTLETCLAFKNANQQIRGFLTSDDDRVNDLYLNETQRYSMKYCADYYDDINELYFVRTDFRLEWHPDIIQSIESKVTDNRYHGQVDILEIFTHEYIALNTTIDKFEKASQWALENGYSFDFPMNNVPRY